MIICIICKCLILCREEKGEKGHHDKEENEGEYEEEKGHKKKHNDEGGYFDEEKKGKKGRQSVVKIYENEYEKNMKIKFIENTRKPKTIF